MMKLFDKFKIKQVGVILIILGAFIPSILYPFASITTSALRIKAAFATVGVSYDTSLQDLEIVLVEGEPKKDSQNGGYNFEGRLAFPYKYAMAFGILLFFIGIGFAALFKNKRESAVASTSHKTLTQEHYIAIGNNLVEDTKTGLEWMAGPDEDTTWDEAKSWVKSLNFDGDGWRMPSTDEFKTLYKRGTGSRNMTPLLKTTGWWVWSGKTKGSSNARAFYFRSGRNHWYGRDSSSGGRAFAVRSRKVESEWIYKKGDGTSFSVTRPDADQRGNPFEEAHRRRAEEIMRATPVTPSQVMSIWNSVEKNLNVELIDVKRLGAAEKKSIVKEAMRGQVASELRRFANIVKIKTGNKIKIKLTPSEEQIKTKYEDLIKEEIRKRNPCLFNSPK